MPISNHRELRVWRGAMDLVVLVYWLCERLPRRETYGLSDQLRRAAVSVPANISEGAAKPYRKEYIRHLAIARGSLKEVETLLEVARRVDMLTDDELRPADSQAMRVGRMLSALIRRLRQPATAAR